MDLDPPQDPNPELDPDPDLDSDPAKIRIHVIPIPALLDMIPDPDPDPVKNGIVTPLTQTKSSILRAWLKRAGHPEGGVDLHPAEVRHLRDDAAGQSGITMGNYNTPSTQRYRGKLYRPEGCITSIIPSRGSPSLKSTDIPQVEDYEEDMSDCNQCQNPEKQTRGESKPQKQEL